MSMHNRTDTVPSGNPPIHMGQRGASRHPRVSVVMPVYNGARHLRTAVESIRNQTFSDFECIIIDDGSTDNTWDMLHAYASRDQRFRLIRNEQNLGITRSLNKGLQLARGAYIARQDADDVSLPERFARQVQYLDTHPQIGLLGTWFRRIAEDGHILDTRSLPSQPVVVRWALLFQNCFIHTSVMMRQSILKQVGPYAADRPYAEDYDLWSRMSFETHIANLPEVLVDKRLSTDRVSARYLPAQEETAMQVMRAAIGRLLAVELDRDMLRNLRKLAWREPCTDPRTVRQVAACIRQLYQRYVQTVPLSAEQQRAITQEAANKLFILASQNLRSAPWAALSVLLQAERLDLRLPAYRTVFGPS